jgi:predicted nucleic acid-binding protein
LYVVDASVWVAFFHDLDKFRKESVEWLTRAISGSVRLVEPSLVLPEIGGSLKRLAKSEQLAKRSVDFVVHMPLMTIVPLGIDRARISAELAAELGVKGADAVYITLAMSEGLELVSWDESQLRSASARIAAHRPSDLL